MRLSTSLKLAVLIPVAYATWAVTSGLMAQQVKPTRTIVIRDAESPSTQPADVDSIRAPVHMTYEYKLKKFDVQVNGTIASVSSSVDMLDTKGDRTYLWRLQSFKHGDAEHAVDIPYLKQMFAIDPSKKTVSPNFTDSIELPQGTHLVILTLYGVPRGFDTKQLDDPVQAKEATLLQHSKTIQIQ
jgi:hypothetical protein